MVRKKTTERHKMANTFRFQGEKQQRRNIIVNAAVNLHDGLIYTGDEDNEDTSQLYKALSHWNELNQHSEFSALLVEIGPDVKTLVQVIHQKERVMNLLLDKMTISSEPYLNGVLGVVDAAVRDLQQEFVSFLPSVLNAMTELILTTKSAQTVELCLNSYSNMLKHLRTHVVEKFGRYLKIFVRLLGGVNVKPHIVENASKCFEFISSKKAKVNPVQFLLKIFGILKISQIQNLEEGIATLIYTMMTSKSAYRPITFSHCLWFINEVPESESHLWEKTVLSLANKLKESRSASTLVPDMWLAMKESFIQSLFSTKFLYCLRIFNEMLHKTKTSQYSTKLKPQTSNNSNQSCIKALVTFIMANQKYWLENSTIKSEMMILGCALIDVESFETTSIPFIKSLIPHLDIEQWEAFDNLLRRHRQVYLKLTPILGQSYRKLLDQFVSSDEQASRLLSWYSNMLLEMDGGIVLPTAIENHPANRFSGSSLPCYYFKANSRTAINITDLSGLTSFVENISKTSTICLAFDDPEKLIENKEEYLRFLLVLRQFDLKQNSAIKSDLFKLIKSIFNKVTTLPMISSDTHTLFAILYMSLEAISSSYDSVDELQDGLPKNFLESLVDWCIMKDDAESKFSIWALKSLDLLLYLLQSHVSLVKKEDTSPTLICNNDCISKLSDNLMSGFKVVRTLTLSILEALTSNVSENSAYLDMHNIFQVALANELNEFDLINLDHDQNYHKLELYIRQADGVKLEVILKYLLGLLFQNCTKIWQLVTNLVSITMKKLGYQSFWRIFSPRFTLFHQTENFCSSIIEDNNSEGFLKNMKEITFGWSTTLQPSSPLGLEDKLDFVSYKVNMWKIILSIESPIPNYIQEEVLLRIHDLHSLTAAPRPFVGVKKDRKSKAALSVLIPALEVLLQCSKSSGDEDIQNICLSLLPSSKHVQKPIIAILCSMSETIRDFISKMDDLGDDQWLKKVHLMKFSGPDADFQPSDRQLFIDFILRLLLSLDAETKGSSKEIINKFLYNCTEEEVQRYTEYVFGTLSDWKALQPLPLKAIIAHINNISNMLTLWRYKFPNIISQLVERVCNFILLAEQVSVHSEAPNEEEVGAHKEPLDGNLIQHRKKALLSAGRLCIVKFFDLFEDLSITEETLNLIFESIIWTSKEDLNIYSSNSISWLLQLMMTWSKIPRYHILFTKCKEQKPESTVMHKMFAIFGSKFLKPKPRLHLIEVVTNLGDSAVVDEQMDIEEEEPDDNEEERKNVEPINCGEFLEVETSNNPLGVGILLSGKEKLFNIIADRSFFQDSALFRNATDKYTRFLRLFAQHSNDKEINEKLSISIIDILPKFRNKPSELVELYELVRELLSSFQPKDSLVIKLGSCLAWTSGKGQREALCKAIAKVMKNKSHAQLIQDLNAYGTGVSDEPNFKKRHEAFEKLEVIIPKLNSMKSVLFSVLASNCFYFISNETDTGMLLIAQGLLKMIAVTIENLSAVENFGAEEEKKIHNFLETSVIPRLKFGVKSKTDAVFDNYLNALSVFGSHCYKFHGTLKGVHTVFQHGDQDILLDLQDIQLSVKARAANKFEFLWPIMRTEPKIVTSFAIPILSHHLLDKSKIKVSFQNMIQCSLEALKWCAISLPHGSYFKYLESVMEQMPQDEPTLLKQYHKLLAYIIDGYHYELDPNFLKSLKQGHFRGDTIQDNKENESVENSKSSDENMENMDVIEEQDTQDCANEETNETQHKTIGEPTITVLLDFTESKSCMNTISKKFIPRLRKYLNLEEKASHKLASKGLDGDSTVIKKIPTTLAYVKLLQKLPKEIRKNHMIWVIPTLCSSLNSKLISVRRNVRETLAKIVQELGPDVFPDIVRSCRSCLTRGFQKHVRNYTLLYILQTLTCTFKTKPECVPVKDIITLVEDELFGIMQEDKNVQAILSATPEAKRKNGLQLLYQCGMYVSPDSLDILLKCPIERARNAKTLQTIKTGKDWMAEISKGLLNNDNVSPYEILHFLHVQIEAFCQTLETLPDPNTSSASASSKFLVALSDSLILPKENKQVAKEGKLALGIVVSWFVFSTLVDLLKDERLDSYDKKTLEILNSFAKLIVLGKRDESLEIRTPSLRCLVFMFALPLKTFDDSKFLQKMWQKYFLAVNDASLNEEINMYYKFLTTFYITFTDHKIDLADLKLLIKCIYKHLQENKCTGSALVLLRNILHRKLISDDLLHLIREVRRHIWTDSQIYLQEGCRAAYLIYMKNYMRSEEEFMADFYEFFEKLRPEINHGVAHSILTMIASMIQIIPESWLTTSLSASLSLDLVTALCRLKDAESQRLISDSCMKTLFVRLEPQHGLEILKELQDTYCKESMISYQRELCLVIRKIIEHKRCWGSEEVTLKAFSMLSDVLKPVPFPELKNKSKIDLKQEYRDHGIFQAILAIYQSLPLVLSSGSVDKDSFLNSEIFTKLEQMLTWIRTEYINYNHEWVQSTSVKCINSQLSFVAELTLQEQTVKLKNRDFLMPLNSKDHLLFLIRQYMEIASTTKIPESRTLVLDGLLLLATLAASQADAKFHETLLKRLRYCVNTEVRESPTSTVTREAVFKFFRKLMSQIPEENLSTVQWTIIRMTTREVTDPNCASEIVSLCKSIQDKFKERLGEKAFLQLYSQTRDEFNAIRENNRAKKKEQVVINMNSGSSIMKSGGMKRKHGDKKKGSFTFKKKRRD